MQPFQSFDENARQESFASKWRIGITVFWIILTCVVFIFTWQRQHPSEPDSSPRIVDWESSLVAGSPIPQLPEQVTNPKPISNSLDSISSPKVDLPNNSKVELNDSQTSSDKPHNYFPEVAGAGAAIALSVIGAPVAVVVGGGMLVWWLIKKWFL